MKENIVLGGRDVDFWRYGAGRLFTARIDEKGTFYLPQEFLDWVMDQLDERMLAIDKRLESLEGMARFARAEKAKDRPWFKLWRGGDR